VDPALAASAEGTVTGLLAVAFLSAGGLMLAGLLLRSDPRVIRSLGQLAPKEMHRPPAVNAILASLGRLVPARLRGSLVGRLRDAPGAPEEPEVVLGWKVVLAVAGSVLGAASGTGMGSVLVAAVVGVAGFRLPDFVLARRGTFLRHAMEAAVPGVIDLVALSVAAGLTPRLALDRVTDVIGGRLGEELREARHEVALGKPWRQALASLAHRTGLHDLRRISLVLDRSERLGTPVSDHLRGLARQVRAERRAADEERARRAPVLMLFPLVFLILPAFVLAAVVPAVLVATRGIP
jgi:tight adherence protein C